jgi:aryl-alcohol dehydrogenase-like predicted oxidoreductase
MLQLTFASSDCAAAAAAAAALLYACRSRWFVASSIIGATSMPQLKENLEAFSITLSQEAIDDVNAVYKRFRDPPIAA